MKSKAKTDIAIQILLKMMEASSDPTVNPELTIKTNNAFHLDPEKIAECFNKIHDKVDP